MRTCDADEGKSPFGFGLLRVPQTVRPNIQARMLCFLRVFAIDPAFDEASECFSSLRPRNPIPA